MDFKELGFHMLHFDYNEVVALSKDINSRTNCKSADEGDATEKSLLSRGILSLAFPDFLLSVFS